MKQLLQQYSAYNMWANRILLERIGQLSEEQVNKEIASSFPGIYKTVLHMMDAESIWWQRLKLAEHVDFPSHTFKGNFEELSRILLQLSQQWEEWIRKANEVNINHVFAYQNSKKSFLNNRFMKFFYIYLIIKLFTGGRWLLCFVSQV